MSVRQKKLYSSMNKKEQDMFDYLVHVEDRKIMMFSFSYIQLFNLVVMISKTIIADKSFQLNKLLLN